MLRSLLDGRLARVTALPDGRLTDDAPVPAACLPGSFNPVHAGHLELAAVAAELLGCPVSFELSVENVDKPPLTIDEIGRRVAQFQGRAPVELTRAATFPEKGHLFPGTTFVVGADTAERLVQARYYGDSEAEMAEALAGLWAEGNRFLVAGRCDAGGIFRTFDELTVPARWRQFFTPIPEARFRIDLSSTELRGE